MRVAILGGGRGWHVRELERALSARGHEALLLPVDGLAAAIGRTPRMVAGGRSLDDCEAVIVRTIPRGSLEQIIFRVDALHRLERMGIVVVNSPGVIEKTVDKFYTSALLEDAGIPTPRTVVAEREADAIAAFRAFGDVIVKPLFGANGRGMVRITDEEVAYRVFRALELERAVYYVQETLPHGGRDVRVFVVGDRAIAAIWRSAPHWRTNLARGGTAEAAPLDAAWTELSVRAARLVGADCAGVDLVPTPDGRIHVIEVNGIPGWRGLQTATGVNIAAAIVERVERRAAEAGPTGAPRGRSGEAARVR